MKVPKGRQIAVLNKRTRGLTAVTQNHGISTIFIHATLGPVNLELPKIHLGLISQLRPNQDI